MLLLQISFYKLKLIKSYSRWIMSQKKLNGLDIISIKKKILIELEYKKLINNLKNYIKN